MKKCNHYKVKKTLNVSCDVTYCPENTERKFIVFESLLIQLFTICVACHKTGANAVISAIIGTMVVVEQSCKTCGNKWRWASQPYIGGMAAGNLLLSASILFAGAVPRKTLKVLGLMG